MGQCLGRLGSVQPMARGTEHASPRPSPPHPEAGIAAARLRRRLRLPACDQDDLRQELLLDLIRRLPAYDPARGSLGAFANVVLRNQATRIAARVMRERRATGGALLSLDAARPDGTTLADTLSEADGLATWQGVPEAIPRAERRIDLDGRSASSTAPTRRSATRSPTGRSTNSPPAASARGPASTGASRAPSGSRRLRPSGGVRRIPRRVSRGPTMSRTHPPPPHASTEADFCGWVGRAAPGDIVEYHRGFLGIDIHARDALRSPSEGAPAAGPPRRLGLRRRARAPACSAATARATSATSRSGGRAAGGAACAGSAALPRVTEPELEEAA